MDNSGAAGQLQDGQHPQHLADPAEQDTAGRGDVPHVDHADLRPRGRSARQNLSAHHPPVTAYDIQIEFPTVVRADRTDATDVKPTVRVLKAVWLAGVDPQFEAVHHVANLMGTRGLTISVQPSE